MASIFFFYFFFLTWQKTVPAIQKGERELSPPTPPPHEEHNALNIRADRRRAKLPRRPHWITCRFLFSFFLCSQQILCPADGGGLFNESEVLKGKVVQEPMVTSIPYIPTVQTSVILYCNFPNHCKCARMLMAIITCFYVVKEHRFLEQPQQNPIDNKLWNMYILFHDYFIWKCTR